MQGRPLPFPRWSLRPLFAFLWPAQCCGLTAPSARSHAGATCRDEPHYTACLHVTEDVLSFSRSAEVSHAVQPFMRTSRTFGIYCHSASLQSLEYAQIAKMSAAQLLPMATLWSKGFVPVAASTEHYLMSFMHLAHAVGSSAWSDTPCVGPTRYEIWRVLAKPMLQHYRKP